MLFFQNSKLTPIIWGQPSRENKLFLESKLPGIKILNLFHPTELSNDFKFDYSRFLISPYKFILGGAYLTSGENPKPLLQLGTATVLGGLMSYRFANSGKIMPAGVVALVSIVVVVRDLIVYNKYLPFIGQK